MPTGGCHCGAVRYEASGDPVHSSVCHCSDCRRCAGAPLVGWTAFTSDKFRVTQGTPKVYASSEHAERSFCGDCGTGLFYVNEQVLPGLVDVQIATFDDPDAAAPQLHVQYAERVSWTETMNDLPKFGRYPG